MGRSTYTPRNLWLPLDAVNAIPTGVARRYVLCGHALVAWREAAGIVVMDDVCPHRGARLSDGQVVAGAIVCPYHGLHFNSAGHCTLAPSEKSLPSLRAHVRESRQWASLILVRLDAGYGPSELPSPPNFVGSCRTLCGPYDWRATAFDVVENFIDVAHLAFVHSGTLGDPAYAEIAPFEAVTIDGRIESTEIRVFQPSPSGQGMPDQSRYAYKIHTPLAAEFRKEFSEEEFRIILLVAPTDQGECKIWLVVAHDATHSPDAIKGFQNDLMEQDRVTIEGINAVRPSGTRILHALASDTLVVAYRKWLLKQGFSLS